MANPNWVPGVSGNPKGLPKGFPSKGRPPNYIKLMCQQLLDTKGVVEFLRAVATGKDAEIHVTMGGKVVSVPVRAALRADTIFKLMDRGYGLPTQSIELSGVDTVHDDVQEAYADIIKSKNGNGRKNPKMETTVKIIEAETV